jgi:UDP-N-acetyl-3-dehydro-alpha-D-glucosamine 3-aminotranferase
MNVPLLDLAAEIRVLAADLDAAFGRLLADAAFIGGEEVRAFEHEFAAYVGAVGGAVGVGNGTDALEIALQALDVGPGDAVLTVAFTFIGTVEAIVRCGARPVLVDVDEADFTMDVEAAAAACQQRRIKAILPVHLYGQPADLEALLALAARHGAALIEDAAQAHGARCLVEGRYRPVGSVGDAGCFSFYPTKNLGALGDAGAVVARSPALAARARLIARHGERGKYEHLIANGRNSRLDALQAAALRLKLRHLDDWNAARRQAAHRYAERLGDTPVRLPRARPGSEHVYHQYVIRHPRRDELQRALRERGVATAVHYPRALHEQSGLHSLGYAPGSFPVAERCAREVLSLPMSPFLDEARIQYVAAAVRESIGALG